MTTKKESILKTAVDEVVQEGVAVLTGNDAVQQGQILPMPEFSTGLATLPCVLRRQLLGWGAQLVVAPGTWGVLHLPGGEQRVYEPGSHWLWNIGAGTVVAQWVDRRRQQVPVGPIEGWSADKWRVRFWLVVEIEVADPGRIAVHREPLSALVAAARASMLRYIEQHTHAELTGCRDDNVGIDGPTQFVTGRLAGDSGLEGLRIVSVRVLERQGDERQIEAATAATVEAGRIAEELRVAAARHQAQLHTLDARAVVAEREHTLRMQATAASAREQLLQQQAEVQRAALAGQLEVVLAQIHAQTTEIAHDEQLWQAEQARLQVEWERVQQQLLEATRTDHHVRLLGTQHGLIQSETEAVLAAEDRRNTHALALAEVQQRLEEQRTLRAQAIAERRAEHEQTLVELHLRHEQLVAEQMQRLEQWRAEQVQISVQQQRQHDRQIAVIAGTAQIAAAAAQPSPPELPGYPATHDVADAGLRTLQALAE